MKAKKRTLADVVKDIPDPKTVIFDPLYIPVKHAPILHLPSDVDPDNPYNLFTLFWPEKLWTVLAINTNMYAIQKQLSSQEERQRPWHDTCAIELKVFVGILIYIGLHQLYSETSYWQQDIKKGPLYTCTMHMGLCRYQAIKRYFHISPTNNYKPHTDDNEWPTPNKNFEKI